MGLRAAWPAVRALRATNSFAARSRSQVLSDPPGARTGVLLISRRAPPHNLRRTRCAPPLRYGDAYTPLVLGVPPRTCGKQSARVATTSGGQTPEVVPTSADFARSNACHLRSMQGSAAPDSSRLVGFGGSLEPASWSSNPRLDPPRPMAQATCTSKCSGWNPLQIDKYCGPNQPATLE